MTNLSKFNKKKVAFVTPSLAIGGAERVTVNIMNMLDRTKYDISCIIIYPVTDEELKEISEDITVIKINKTKVSKSIISIFLAIRSINPDIVFTSLFRTNIILSALKKFTFGSFSLICRSPNSPRLLVENKEMSFMLKNLINFSYRNCDRVVAQTDEMSNEIINIHKVSDSKLVTLLNPLDTNRIDYLSMEECELPDINSFKFLASGRLTHQKGFDVLLNAFCKLIKCTNESVSLHILGAGPEINTLKNFVNDNKLSEFVYFHGHQSNPYPFYKACDVFVLSSRWEGLPNVVLEALYLNKFVISTRCIKYLENRLSDGTLGSLVPVDNSEELFIAMKKSLLAKYNSGFDKSGEKSHLGNDLDYIFEI